MAALPDFAVIADAGRVEAWSVRRLPFEPRGTMLEFRSALRAGLAGLDATAGRLSCVYSSPLPDLCDAENVLLYNVGMSSFARLTHRSVAFERADTLPASPVQLSGTALHHHLYTVDPSEPFDHWRVEGVLASWEGDVPPRVDKAAGWWWETRAARQAISATQRADQPFGLRIQVGGVRRSTASLIKPMLDGVIAAFHFDDAPAHEAVDRLAHHLGRPESDVREQLTVGGAPLGRRALVRPFREGLQWNPADDLCVACAIDNSGPQSPPAIRGELLALARVRP